MSEVQSVTIDALSSPILASPELTEDLKAAVGEMRDAVAAGSNWVVRKKTILDIVEGIDVAYAGMDEEDRSDDEGQPDVDVADVLPAYVGGILEALGEDRISTVEQAACYLLSAHPEHQEAALAWIDTDRKTATAFRKLLRTDRRYAYYFKRISEQAGEAVGEEETGDEDGGSTVA
ncbi:MAG TPA: hypothetical protein VEY95_08615 [Azospirillaceae bacterium]|nr:hypothetical protein [Azospirillaceae bacterium]